MDTVELSHQRQVHFLSQDASLIVQQVGHQGGTVGNPNVEAVVWVLEK